MEFYVTPNLISVFLPNWFLLKKGIKRNPNCLDGKIIKVTPKAILFELHPILASFHCVKELWIPKSLVLKKVDIKKTEIKKGGL